MSAILREDPPDLPVTERHVPPALARIVSRCLEKNPAARFQSTRDLAFALEALSTHSGQTEAIVVPRSPARRKQLVALVGAALLLVAATAAGVGYLKRAAPLPVHKLSILPPQGITALGRVAVSPDGRQLAFTARSEGRLMLWVRPLDSASAMPLNGTEGAVSPFWSPDSRSIGFFAQGKLKRISISGGPAQTLCDAPGGRASGKWSREGVILFNPDQLESLYQVPAGGGTPQAVTKVDRANGEVAHDHPSFLPDGRHFLYSVKGADIEDSWIKVGELGSAESRPLVKTNSNGVYVGSDGGDYPSVCKRRGTARTSIRRGDPCDCPRAGASDRGAHFTIRRLGNCRIGRCFLSVGDRHAGVSRGCGRYQETACLGRSNWTCDRLSRDIRPV